MAKCGPINRLIIHRAKGLSGPMGQNVGGGNCVAVPGYAWAPGGANYGATLISARIENANPDLINLTFNGPLTAITAACGWTYSVNGGVDTAPSLASITDAKLVLQMGADVVCGDTVTVSYDATGCDLAVDGEAFESITDSSVTNGVNTPVPVITVQPTNQAVTAPTAATFSLTAIGATGYQWQLNGVDIPGATLTSYTTDATVDGQTGDYRCRVSNDCGSVFSDVATLTVTAPVPVFDGLIANMTSTVGTPMTPYDASVHFGTGGPVASYALNGAPAWMVINETTGVITGTPNALANTTGITVKGTNSGGSDSSNVWAMDAQAPLQAPVFDGVIPDMTSVVGELMSPYDASTHFNTGDPVSSYSLQNTPSWMNINPTTGVIFGVPDAEAVTAGITVTGTNAAGSDTSNIWQMDAQAGGPTTYVQDSFTAANDTALIDHTPEIDVVGNGYTELFGVGEINTGAFKPRSLTSNKSANIIDIPAANFEVSASIAPLIAGGGITAASLYGRASDAFNYWIGYAGYQESGDVLNASIYERTANVNTQRATGSANGADGSLFKVSFNGQTVIVTFGAGQTIQYDLAANNETVATAGIGGDSQTTKRILDDLSVDSYP